MRSIKKMASFLCVTMVLLTSFFALPLSVQAASENDLTFELNADGKSYTVTGCDTSTTGSVQIPATYNNKPVTAIGKGAFRYCEKIETVVIPDSVTHLGDGAFECCRQLSKVTLSKNITAIPKNAFMDCILSGITIPSEVTYIGENAFMFCRFTEVDIPKGVQSIERQAFLGCVLLERINIPNSVTLIGEKAFYLCSKLKEITIPNSVTHIGIDAFVSCTALNKITIPAGITEFKRGFAQSGVVEVFIEEGVTKIPPQAFSPGNVKIITIPKSVTEIDASAFDKRHPLEKVFYRGTRKDKYEIAMGDGNVALSKAEWHYEVQDVSIQGIKLYYCADCDRHYLPNGDFVEVEKSDSTQNVTTAKPTTLPVKPVATTAKLRTNPTKVVVNTTQASGISTTHDILPTTIATDAVDAPSVTTTAPSVVQQNTGGNLWWLWLIAGIVLGGGVVGWIIIKKKK